MSAAACSAHRESTAERRSQRYLAVWSGVHETRSVGSSLSSKNWTQSESCGGAGDGIWTMTIQCSTWARSSANSVMLWASTSPSRSRSIKIMFEDTALYAKPELASTRNGHGDAAAPADATTFAARTLAIQTEAFR
eukprot:Amastigsp_a676697_5.p3 type:complete len:136 gc:universal Amastigsp_a676697_5:1054-647(-)